MELRGNVTKGLGVAKKWVKKIDNIFKEKIGIDLFEGTLNIRLESEYVIEPDFIIKPEQFGGSQNVLVKKCEVFGEVAYIVRAEKNQKGVGDHDLKIIEIVSNKNFRDTFKIKDNDLIKIKII